MLSDFREIKTGFVNLSLDFLEPEELKIAGEYAFAAKRFLKEELQISVIELKSAITNKIESKEAWHFFIKNSVDAVILFNGTFSTGDVTAEIVRNLDIPYLIWGIEEFTIKTTHNFIGSMVGVLPQGTIFKNFGKKFSFVYGNISKKSVKDKVNVFVNVVRAIAYLREATIGVIGMRPDGFEISDFDELSIKNKFGASITKVSMYYFTNLIKSISDKETDEDMKFQSEIFDINKKDILEARVLSKTYLALKKVIEEKNLKSYAPDCWPELRDQDKTPICPANGRLNEEGIMASCECDVDGSLTLMLLYALSKTTPWLADFVNYIEEEDKLLFWHCGNAPYNLCADKPKIERVFGGLLQTAVLRSGVATVCRLNSIRGRYMIHAGVGEVIDSGILLKGSNLTIRMKNGNFRFIESLIENGIPHHNAIVYGDISDSLKEFANLMNIPIILLN